MRPGQALCLKLSELWAWGKTQAVDGMDIYKYINSGQICLCHTSYWLWSPCEA